LSKQSLSPLLELTRKFGRPWLLVILHKANACALSDASYANGRCHALNTDVHILDVDATISVWPYSGHGDCSEMDTVTYWGCCGRKTLQVDPTKATGISKGHGAVLKLYTLKPAELSVFLKWIAWWTIST